MRCNKTRPEKTEKAELHSDFANHPEYPAVLKVGRSKFSCTPSIIGDGLDILVSHFMIKLPLITLPYQFYSDN